jgi:hypothetical protein
MKIGLAFFTKWLKREFSIVCLASLRQIAASVLSHDARLGLSRASGFTVQINNRQMSVRSARFSRANSRGLVQRRPVPLDDYTEADVDAPYALVKEIRGELRAAKSPAHLLRRCQAAIRADRQHVGAPKNNLRLIRPPSVPRQRNGGRIIERGNCCPDGAYQRRYQPIP